jgi:CBS domain-containing protein
MQVREILSEKGSTVYTCSPNDSLADVVDLLVGYNCGSLVVSENGEMVGIITERDILRACAMTRQSLEVLSVRDRMTRCPVTATPDDEIADTMGAMTEHRIRHLPVVDGGRLAGVVSIGDVVKAQHNELCRENYYLKSYILG